MFNVHGGTVDYLNSAVVYTEMVICLFKNMIMSNYRDRVIHCEVTKPWFHQFYPAPWGQSNMPKVLCYPQCFTLIIVLELSTLQGERLKHREKGQSKKDMPSCQCPDELTPEAHSLWGHRTHSQAPS